MCQNKGFALETKENILYSNNRGSDSVIYPSIDKLLNVAGSKYLLVNLISKRIDEMEKLKNYQMSEEEYVSKKDIGKALEEIAKGYVKIKAD